MRYIGIEKEGSRLRKALPVAWIHRTCAHTHSETWNSRIIEKTRWSNALVIPESKNKDVEGCSAINVLDSLVAAEFEKKCSTKLTKEDDLANIEVDVGTSHNQVFGMESKHTVARVGKQFESLELLERILKSHKSSVEEPPALELKPLPTHLRDSGLLQYFRSKNWPANRASAPGHLPISLPDPIPHNTSHHHTDPVRRQTAPAHCSATTQPTEPVIQPSGHPLSTQFPPTTTLHQRPTESAVRTLLILSLGVGSLICLV
ncbi:hypothetical protein TIFTF001_048791 [Ficus carica]|uniref:Uncharacterized protein n=1 Tax=Ficus carica TaxID=3494 RepID=A0AA88CWX7_FICCA|nr:hypothetical protein TIFTF001_048791 [Ficus carica]